jgi:diaminopimelate decarboxylase
MNDFFPYVDGEMTADSAPLRQIAEAVGTPFYVYSTSALKSAYAAYADAFAGMDIGIRYAVKANGNLSIIRTLAALGAGADVVSGGEMHRAVMAGVPPEKIVFSGVGKTIEEMRTALEAGVEQINVESEPELEQLSNVANTMGVVAPISLRINPNVDALTHAKITTGKSDNKFGIDIDRAPNVFTHAATLPGIKVKGIAVHIGSQLLDLEPYRQAYGIVADMVSQLRHQEIAINHIDLGGGLGIACNGEFPPSIAAYARVVRETVGSLGCRLLLEPGRSLVGNAGMLVSRILYIKDSSTRRFIILDAAMNDLMRPALYESFHSIRPVMAADASASLSMVDVVGPICETGDTFATKRQMPPLSAGDLVGIADAGAYGMAMASTYNSRPLVPEVMCRDGAFAVVNRRQTIEETMARETLPPWLMDHPPSPNQSEVA